MNEKAVAILIAVLALVFAVVQPFKLTILLGWSMEPTISHGDIVVYTQYETAESGDIIVFDADGVDGVLAHRVVEETESGLVTKGDNNSDPDTGVVDEGDLRGEVVLVVPVPDNLPVYEDVIPDGYPDNVTS